jgi:hypothetical protein
MLRQNGGKNWPKCSTDFCLINWTDVSSAKFDKLLQTISSIKEYQKKGEKH